MWVLHRREGPQRPQCVKGGGPKDLGVAAPLAAAGYRGKCWRVVHGLGLSIFYVLWSPYESPVVLLRPTFPATEFPVSWNWRWLSSRFAEDLRGSAGLEGMKVDNITLQMIFSSPQV